MKAEVHVVGAGLAGAAAAVALSRAGRRVVVWEAARQPGGRVSGFIDRQSGEYLDNGPHLFMGCYRRTRALLGALGTADQVVFQSSLTLPMRHAGRSTGLTCPALPGPWFLLLGLLGLDGLSWMQRLHTVRAGAALLRPVAEGDSVSDWLKDAATPIAATEILWGPLCRAVMNLQPEEADAATFVAALKQALTGTHNAACLGWARNGLSALLGDGFSGWLSRHGGTLRHVRIRQVIADDQGRVAGLVDAQGARHATRSVVLACPPWGLGEMLPERVPLIDLRSRLSALAPAAVSSVYLWFAGRPVPMGRTPFVGLMGGKLEWLFDRDRVAGVTVDDGVQRLAGVISAADPLNHWPQADVVALAMREISAQFPAVAQARLLDARVVRERRATIRITPTCIRPQPGAVPGVPGLYLAGDYTDTGLPATIEGAVQSGETAVRALLASD